MPMQEPFIYFLNNRYFLLASLVGFEPARQRYIASQKPNTLPTELFGRPTRLRLNCSSLNQHLFHKNIIDNPHCECGAVEDTQHFFLRCNLYRNLRQELLNKISTFCQPTLDVILYGSSHIPVEENTQIFLAVQNFIIKTKRF